MTDLIQSIEAAKEPSAEPVADHYALARQIGKLIRADIDCRGRGEHEAAAVIASALEAARREALEWVTEQHKKADEYAARIAALEAKLKAKTALADDHFRNVKRLAGRCVSLEADKARLMGLVEEAQSFMRHGPYCDTLNPSYTGHDTAMMGKFPCTCGLATVSSKIKEATDGN